MSITNSMLSYDEAKAVQQSLERKNNADSAKLRGFKKYGVSPLGGTPDHVKLMPEWREAKNNFNASFAELRNFNGWFVKTFKKEYAAERKNRFQKAEL